MSDAIAINVPGKILSSTDASFTSGISLNESRFEQNVTASLSDLVNIQRRISVDAKLMESQPIEILVVIAQSADSESALRYSMLNANGKRLAWDGNLENLVPFQTLETSAAPIEVQIYNGSFLETGVWYFYFGYRSANGIIVYSPQSLDVTITK